MTERIDRERGIALFVGDCVEGMASLPENSIDAIVTDPPYGLEFMGKEWDSLGKDVGGQIDWHKRWAAQAIRVLKPGGHVLSFSGSRTSQYLAVGLELAGFEIRDTLSWMYGTGFPKSMKVSMAIDKAAKGHPQGSTKGDPDSPNSGKFKTQATEGKRTSVDKGQHFGAGPGQFMQEQGEKYERDLVPEAQKWQGWGTALKPAWEPIILARKPLIGNVAKNVLTHGTGALNIDATRLAIQSEDDSIYAKNPHTVGTIGENGIYGAGVATEYKVPEGRFPANVLLTHDERCGDECAPDCPAAMLDAQSGVTKSSPRSPDGEGEIMDGYGGWRFRRPSGGFSDSGGVSRFFYSGKASYSDRELGLIGKLPCAKCGGVESTHHPKGKKEERCRRNDHPTVKPVALMQYLVRLVTPPGGVVLDPFTGSGSTGVAARREGFRFMGMEIEEHSADIAWLRMLAAQGELSEEEDEDD